MNVTLLIALCCMGAGIVVTVVAIALGIWFLSRRGISIVASKNGAIRWHGDA